MFGTILAILVYGFIILGILDVMLYIAVKIKEKKRKLKVKEKDNHVTIKENNKDNVQS